MPADVMTKMGPQTVKLAMMEFLRKGTLCLVDEGGHLTERSLNQALKSGSRGASMRALQEEEGNVQSGWDRLK